MQESRADRRLVIVADIEGYSLRSAVLQNEAQAAFGEMLADAGRAAGLDRTSWLCQATGDGEVAVLPAGVDEPIVFSRYLPAIDAYLRRYNAHRAGPARIRVRVAVHQGLFFVDSANGFAGPAVNHTARLVDAPLLKTAFQRFPYAMVACIVSDGIYEDVVTGGYDGISPERFRRIRVELPDKKFAADAWIEILGEDVTKIGLPPPVDAAPRAGKKARRRPHGGVSVGDVDNYQGQIAIGHDARAYGSVPPGEGGPR